MSRARRNRAPALLVAAAILAAILFLLLGSAGDGTDTQSKGATGPGAHGRCTSTVSSIGAAESAVETSPPGTVVCLAGGAYGELSLDADQEAPGVTLRAARPGRATLSAVDLNGTHLTLARFDVAGEVTIEPGSRAISVIDNRIHGGYFGLNAGPTTSTSIADTTVRGNLFAGPFGEDAIRLNRYHDSADPDPYGILIEGNEITGVRENGNHSDCLQSVWGGDGLYFRRNYLHDNRCQGFFVKDQPATVRRVVVEDNLMLRNAAPCDPPDSGCGPPAIVQVFGPIAGLRIERNTIWTSGNRSPLVLGDGPFGSVEIADNVLFRGWSEWAGGFPRFEESGDTICQWEGTLPRLSPSASRSCRPRFREPADDDYRLRRGDAGIDWSPAGEQYGAAAD